MTNLKKVLIMAGGTGGHIFPALAIANTLRENNIDIHWLGTEKGLEAKVIPDAHIPLHYISISGIRNKGAYSLFMAPFRLTIAIWQAMRIIKKLQPDIVIGFGGYVSGPGGIASVLLGKPLIIHEQNAKAGTTNRYLSYVAKKILEGFPNTFTPTQKVVMIGNPVRKEIVEVMPPEERFKNRTGPLRLLVMGGSLGAIAINELVPAALAKISASERPVVRHQTGEKNYQKTLELYSSLKVSAEVMPFISDMAEAYQWADILICRAGASTIAELCAVGIGSLLIPYPHAVDDHQTENAYFLSRNGAAQLIQQSELTEAVLVEWIKEIAKSAEKRLSMAQSAFNLRRIDVSKKVFEICEEICQ